MTSAIDISGIRFDEKGLVPAIAQDAGTLEVLMSAFMNKEALEATLSTRQAHFFSRSRNKLWLKGETSGNVLDVKAVRYDCDADCILMLVAPRGPACHTGERSCFYRRLDEGGPAVPPGASVITDVFKVVEARKTAPPDKSYVASLYAKGMEKIIEKVEEESGELVKAARDEGHRAVVHEAVDLWFHTMVLLAERGVKIDEVFAEFGRRFGIGGHDEKAARPPKTEKP